MSDEYPTKGAVTVEVVASPAEVYAFLTDLDRLPTISPENERCEFLEGHDAIAIGATSMPGGSIAAMSSDRVFSLHSVPVHQRWSKRPNGSACQPTCRSS